MGILSFFLFNLWNFIATVEVTIFLPKIKRWLKNLLNSSFLQNIFRGFWIQCRQIPIPIVGGGYQIFFQPQALYHLHLFSEIKIPGPEDLFNWYLHFSGLMCTDFYNLKLIKPNFCTHKIADFEQKTWVFFSFLLESFMEVLLDFRRGRDWS